MDHQGRPSRLGPIRSSPSPRPAASPQTGRCERGRSPAASTRAGPRGRAAEHLVDPNAPTGASA
eukprot:90861-Lingulodinium_polyedra.AAC.2